MTKVDEYLTTEMFEYNALLQFSIASFIYHNGWFCDLGQSQSIQGQGYKLEAKAKKFGLKAKAKASLLRQSSQIQHVVYML